MCPPTGLIACRLCEQLEQVGIVCLRGLAAVKLSYRLKRLSGFDKEESRRATRLCLCPRGGRGESHSPVRWNERLRFAMPCVSCQLLSKTNVLYLLRFVVDANGDGEQSSGGTAVVLELELFDHDIPH